MANEICVTADTGLTLYAVLRRRSGGGVNQYWNTAGTPAFENYTSGNWADYDVTLTEAAPGQYHGDMPAVGAGTVAVLVYERLGGTPALTDRPLGAASYYFDGSNLLPEGGAVQTGDSFARIGASGAGLTSVVLAATGVNAVLIDGIALPKALQVMAAVLCGKITTAGEAIEIFVGLDGVTTRATITVDDDGNRTAAAYNTA